MSALEKFNKRNRIRKCKAWVILTRRVGPVVARSNAVRGSNPVVA